MVETHLQTAVDEPEDFGTDDESVVKRWLSEINVADKEFRGAPRNWMESGDNIVKRYRDEHFDQLSSEMQNRPARFNILWANVQLLKPALYAKTPIPEIVRRFKDRDPVSRAAATMLERAITYTVDTQDYDDVMGSVVLDRLLPGRGTAWVRYVPTMRDVTPQVPVSPHEVGNEEFDEAGDLVASSLQYQDDDGGVHQEDSVLRDDDDMPYIEGEPYEEVATEKVVVDYVFWKDFLHNPGRTWAEVRWVGRRNFMTRTQLRDRFGKEIGDAVKLDYLPHNIGSDEELGSPSNETFKKAVVYEIWDKETKKAYWISKGYDHKPLDVVDDPLGLEGFFPCPKPLFATMTTDKLIPVADYVEYFDQAQELDELTGRMKRLMKVLKLMGVYNAEIKEKLQQMVDSGENDLIPVDNWAMFAQKGGMDQVQFFPLEEVAKTLAGVVQIREQVKQDLYEIVGLSDIMRGASKASETATAQRIKGQYGSLRLKHSVEEVQRFNRDLFRIIGEIIAEQFSPETIRNIAGMEIPSRLDIQQAQMAVAELDDREEKLKKLPPKQAQQISAQIPTPKPSEIENLRDVASNVAFEDVIELLRDQGVRTFRLDIETDSTIAIDEQEDKKNRTEFLSAATGFMQMSAQMGTQVPEYIPALGEMLMFGVRGFKAGRSLEDSLEDALQAIKRKTDQMSDQPQEDPQAALEGQKLQLEGQKVALEGQKIETDRVLGEAKIKVDADKVQVQALKDRSALDMEKEKIRAGDGSDAVFRDRELALQERKMALDERQMALDEAVATRPDIDDAAKLVNERAMADKKMDFDAEQNALDRQTDLRKVVIGKSTDSANSLVDGIGETVAQLAAQVEQMTTIAAADKEIVRDEVGTAIGVRIKQ